jgi:hypothetical protein
MAKKKTKQKVEKMELNLPAIKIARMKCTIKGLTALITNKFSDKARQQIEDKQQKKAKAAGRQKREPKKEYEASMYRLPSGSHCIKAIAVKKAMVNAAKDDKKGAVVRRSVFVLADGRSDDGDELIKLKAKPKMNKTIKICKNGSADLRYRALYDPWSAEITIEFIPNLISAEQVLNYIQLAGFCVGIHEDRPMGKESDSTGDKGRFCVVPDSVKIEVQEGTAVA